VRGCRDNLNVVLMNTDVYYVSSKEVSASSQHIYMAAELLYLFSDVLCMDVVLQVCLNLSLTIMCCEHCYYSN
jgi:hypothetical protein